MRRLKLVLLFLFSTNALACKCFNPEVYQDENTETVKELFTERAVAVFHGRVRSTVSGEAVELDVLRVFRGPMPIGVRPMPGPDSACGTRFVPGEEYVYLSIRGEVSACGKLEPTKSLISVLERATVKYLPKAAKSSNDMPGVVFVKIIKKEKKD